MTYCLCYMHFDCTPIYSLSYHTHTCMHWQLTSIFGMLIKLCDILKCFNCMSSVGCLQIFLLLQDSWCLHYFQNSYSLCLAVFFSSASWPLHSDHVHCYFCFFLWFFICLLYCRYYFSEAFCHRVCPIITWVFSVHILMPVSVLLHRWLFWSCNLVGAFVVCWFWSHIWWNYEAADGCGWRLYICCFCCRVIVISVRVSVD